ncbi:MAG: patatin-like phospholipase family protein [Cyclobacteriaceae bacterium]|jgi:NTE family protein
MKKLFVIFLTSVAISTNAQDKRPPIENLVMEGAGVRGIAYVGAIQQLQEQGNLSQLKRLGGTSAGAIAALLVSLGYTADEMELIISETRVQQFNDGQYFFVGGLYRMNKYYGWYRNEAVNEWLGELIAQKTGNSNLTFQQLHDLGYRDLYVTGTSINNQRTLIFSHETYPDMRVRDAVNISMNVPLYFQAIWINDCGVVLDPMHATGTFDIVVDGGVAANFPIDLFDEYTIERGKPVRCANPHTLGLRIDTAEQIEKDRTRLGLAPVPVKKLKHFINGFYVYSIESLNRPNLTEEDWQRTISISSADIQPRIRKMKTAEKELLLHNGREAVIAQF